MSSIISKVKLTPQKHIDSIETSSLSYCSFSLGQFSEEEKATNNVYNQTENGTCEEGLSVVNPSFCGTSTGMQKLLERQ